MRFGWMICMPLVLSACGPGALLIDEPAPSTDVPVVPTDEPPGFPEGIRFEFTPSPDQLTLEIFNGNSLYDYGFADTGSPRTYFGEDCHFSGVCHPAGRTGVVLRVGDTIVPGSITAFREVAPERARANLTHMVRDRLQDLCWVWGEDPSHFGTLDCIVIGDTTGTPVPPTEPERRPTFEVRLFDGDGLPDGLGGVDADRLQLVIEDGFGFYEFGYAQTAFGINGWFGEDCMIGEFCHPSGPTGLQLERVPTIAAIEPGQTMLLPVDYPESLTPPLTYYVREVATDRCWTWGDDVSYYAFLDCEEGP